MPENAVEDSPGAQLSNRPIAIVQPVQNSDANDISNDAKSNGDHIALQQDPDLSQIAKLMQETNKIIQMMMVTNVGTENFEKARKLIDGVESPVTIEEKEEDEIVLLSAADRACCGKTLLFYFFRHSDKIQLIRQIVNKNYLKIYFINLFKK